MPRGYRSVILALVGCLILCGAKPPSEQRHRADGSDNTAVTTQATATPTPSPAASPSNNFTAYRGYDPDPCYHAKDHDAADLCAQWRASIAAEKAAHEARRATNWSIIATVLNVVSLLLVALALIVTVQANKVSRKIGQAQTRAYLTLKGIEAHLTEGAAALRPILKNGGQSPALNIRYRSITSNSKSSYGTLRRPTEEFPGQVIEAGGEGDNLSFWHVEAEPELAGDLENGHPIQFQMILTYYDVFSHRRKIEARAIGRRQTDGIIKLMVTEQRESEDGDHPLVLTPEERVKWQTVTHCLDDSGETTAVGAFAT